MTKIRKLKRKKKFRYVNKKRLNNKRRKTPNIKCKEIKESWDNRMTVQKNLENMGLAHDPNLVVSSAECKPVKRKRNRGSKTHVVKQLEEEAKAPRDRLLKLPKTQVSYLTYLLDKYGDDYKAMAKDPKNYYQETWKQIRAKIKTFQGIPEQYSEYLKSKGEVSAASSVVATSSMDVDV